MKLFASIAAASVLALTGCSTLGAATDEVVTEVTSAATLADVLASQPDEVKARYDARHPGQTLAFFDIEPGMTVVEALPGGGWYSKILIPYLGEDGTLIGAHYPDELWPQFGFGDEWSAARAAATANWLNQVEEWGVEGAEVKSDIISVMEGTPDGSVDAVLFIRAMHNLSRFNEGDGYFDDSISAAYRVLKPGGVVGVVQHRAPESAPDESTKGQRGYLKQTAVIEAFEAAGFELADISELNANPNDNPGADQVVWRLPPSLNGTEEGTPERAAMEAIGESDRMTLKFKKPA